MSDNGWSEWSRFVLSELKRFGGDLVEIKNGQSEMNSRLAEYNGELRLHIQGVRKLDVKTDLIREEVDTFKKDVDTRLLLINKRLEVAEKPILWASSTGSVLKWFGVAGSAGAAAYGFLKLVSLL